MSARLRSNLLRSVTAGFDWGRNGATVEVWIEDEGPGLAGTTNLFVPFFTTKPGGTGIGLALSRQIAEAHGGVLTLENRTSGPGCQARLKLLSQPQPFTAELYVYTDGIGQSGLASVRRTGSTRDPTYPVLNIP